MRNKSFVFTTIFLLLISATTSLSDSGDTIKIGVIFAKTGNAAVVTLPGFEAVRFAADEINKAGGVLEKKIVLIEYDNKSTSLGSKFAAQQAVKDGVAGVIGLAFSSHSLAAAKVLQDAKISMISPIATNIAVTLVGNYIFRICYVDTFQGRIVAEFAQKDLNADTAVVLTNSSRIYSLGLAKVFIEIFNRLGKTLWEGYYQVDMTDFSALLKKIKRINPDIIFVPGHFRESAYIVKQARSMGLKTTFIGADGWQETMYKYGGKAIDGNYYITQWHKNISSSENQRFVKKWLKGHKKVDEPVIALSYDAFYVLINAIKRAGTVNSIAVRQALSQTKNFPGVTGKITFDENGDTVNRSAVIMKFENGNAIFQKRVNQ